MPALILKFARAVLNFAKSMHIERARGLGDFKKKGGGDNVTALLRKLATAKQTVPRVTLSPF